MSDITLTPSSHEKHTLESLNLVKEHSGLTESCVRFSTFINDQDPTNPNKYMLLTVDLEKNYIAITCKTDRYFYCFKLDKNENLTADELDLTQKMLKFVYYNNPKFAYTKGLTTDEIKHLKNTQKAILTRKKADITLTKDGQIKISDFTEPDLENAIKQLDEAGL